MQSRLTIQVLELNSGRMTGGAYEIFEDHDGDNFAGAVI